MNFLRGKNVIITGASSGLGRHVATILIKKYGCTVLGTGTRVEKLIDLKESLSSFGDKFLYFTFDVSKENGWIDFAKHIEKLDVKFDILINNAGIMPKFEKAANQPLDQTLKVLDTDFLSAVYSVKHVLPMLADNKGLVNISSSSALCPVIGQAIYSASKSALKSFTEAMRAESDFYVGLIMPGFCKTEIFRSIDMAKKDKGLIDKIAQSPERCAIKIVRAIKNKRAKRIIGFDAHLMRLLYFLFPKNAPRIMGWFLRKSNLQIFSNLSK